MKHNKSDIFYLLIVVYTVFLILLFFKVIHIPIDKYSSILLFGFIGISLLPFADKLKIGNVIEFERLKEKVEKVEETQYLGEVLKTKTGDLFYYDHEGLHQLPDEQTADFLKSRKGILDIKNSEFKFLHRANNIDSVRSGRLLQSENGVVFVILNNKKYYVNSWAYIIDWGRLESDAEVVENSYLSGIPSAMR